MKALAIDAPFRRMHVVHGHAVLGALKLLILNRVS